MNILKLVSAVSFNFVNVATIVFLVDRRLYIALRGRIMAHVYGLEFSTFFKLSIWETDNTVSLRKKYNTYMDFGVQKACVPVVACGQVTFPEAQLPHL